MPRAPESTKAPASAKGKILSVVYPHQLNNCVKFPEGAQTPEGAKSLGWCKGLRSVPRARLLSWSSVISIYIVRRSRRLSRTPKDAKHPRVPRASEGAKGPLRYQGPLRVPRVLRTPKVPKAPEGAKGP